MIQQYPQWFGLTFLVGSISMLVFTLIRRKVMSVRRRKWDYLRVDFTRSLASMIAEEDFFKSGNFNSGLQLQLAQLKHKVNSSSIASQLMVDQIMTLRQNVSGRAVFVLDEIYALLDLHQFSIQKLTSSRLKIKAQGIRELTSLSHEEAIGVVEGSRQADGRILMSSTLMALAGKEKKDLSFIDSYRGELTYWMQLNIHNHFLEVEPDAVPNFSRWFNSSNISVALFAIRMSGAFRQRTAIPDLKALLSHPQVAIVEFATAALGAIGVTGLQHCKIDEHRMPA